MLTKMLTIDEIRIRLRDRRSGVVAKACGVSVATISTLRAGTNINPRYRLYAALSEYLSDHVSEPASDPVEISAAQTDG